MSEIIETTLVELSPLQELATLQPVVTFTGALQKNDITPEYIAKVKTAIASINTDLNTDEDFAVAATNSKACKVAEDHLSNLLNKIVSGNKDIAQVTEDVNGIIADLSRTRLTIDKKVKERKISLKKEITDAGKKEINRVLSLSSLSKIWKPDLQSIENCISRMSSYDKMREKVTANVNDQIYVLAWTEQTYINNSQLIMESLIRYPGIHSDQNLLCLEPTDKVRLIIAEREATQALLLKKQEEDRIAAAAKAEEERIAKAKKEAEELAEKQLATENAAIAKAKKEADELAAKQIATENAAISAAEADLMDPADWLERLNNEVPEGFGKHKEPSPFDDIADPFSNATFGQIPPLSVIQYRFRVTFKTADVAEVIHAIEAIGGHVKTEILD